MTPVSLLHHYSQAFLSSPASSHISAPTRNAFRRPCTRRPRALRPLLRHRRPTMSKSQPAESIEPPQSPSATQKSIVTDAMLAAAHAAADAAGAVIRRYFRRPDAQLAQFKDDESPVTVADREAEAAIRAVLSAAFPAHCIVGEEAEAQGELDSPYAWVVDPIDGTRAFVCGKPTFGTLISLTYEGVPVLGLVDQPVLRERWVGAVGFGTTFNGDEVKVSGLEGRKLEDCIVQATTPEMFEGQDALAFRTLGKACRNVVYGSDCYAYALLASGCGDLVVEANLKPWDFCALVPVVEGAGGAMCDWQGLMLSMDSDGRVVAASDEGILREALAVLQSVIGTHIDDLVPGEGFLSEPLPNLSEIASNGHATEEAPHMGSLESMTGYGSARVEEGNATVNVQLRSVNSRYCEVQVRGPDYLRPFDSVFSSIVKQEMMRGKLTLSLSVWIDKGEGRARQERLAVEVDADAARAVRALLNDVAGAADLGVQPTVADVLRFSEVLVKRDVQDLAQQVLPIAKKALSRALQSLRAARRREGAILEADLLKRTKKISSLLGEIEERAPERVEKQRERLRSITNRLVSTSDVYGKSLEYEITLFSDRVDITEEIVRLRAHVRLFEMTLLASGEPVGQRLGFLLQEKQREATTIASKATDAPIAHLAVLMKEEIEKIREQCQNIR